MMEAITRIGIWSMVGIAVSWDVFVIAHGEYDATISVIMYESAKKHPIIPFTIGVVLGHMFWQIYEG